jgi:hypothetical protein
MSSFDDEEDNKESLEWKMDEEIPADETKPPNESPIEKMNPEFKKSLAKAKHIIYEETVLEPEENTSKAQDLNLINEYRMFIQIFYLLSLRARKGELIRSADISFFPEASQKIIENLLHWVRDFFKNNEPKDTILYSHYMDMMLKDMPFYQEEDCDLLPDNNSITV